MRVTIDTDRCTGHGRCYAVAPGLFTDDERGYGQVIGDGDVTGMEAEAERAVTACPERAIVIAPTASTSGPTSSTPHS